MGLEIVEGEVAYWLFEGDKIVGHKRKKNMVVVGSRAYLADLVRGYQFSSQINAFAIGTGPNPPTINDTILTTEVYRMSIPTAGTDTPLQANLLLTNPARVLLRQTFTPFIAGTGVTDLPAVGGTNALSGTQNIKEFGLFGDIVTVANPSAAPTISVAGGSGGGGTVINATYNIKFTYVNDNGESAASLVRNHVQTNSTSGGTSGTFTLNFGQAPSQAKKILIYIESAGSGFYYKYGTEVTNLVPNPVTQIITSIPGPGTQAPTVNTTSPPGIKASGRLINHTLIDPSGVAMTATAISRIQIESILTFG